MTSNGPALHAHKSALSTEEQPNLALRHSPRTPYRARNGRPPSTLATMDSNSSGWLVSPRAPR